MIEAAELAGRIKMSLKCGHFFGPFHVGAQKKVILEIVDPYGIEEMPDYGHRGEEDVVIAGSGRAYEKARLFSPGIRLPPVKLP